MEQDPVKVAPHAYKVLLENEWVRVLEGNYKKGEKSPMHWHPGRVNYLLSNGKIKVVSPDGGSRVEEVKAGVARWREPVSHSTENIGDSDIHFIVVELKGSKK